MKNAIVIILFLGFGLLVFTACNQAESKKESANESTQMRDESDKPYALPLHTLAPCIQRLAIENYRNTL